ncbi:MAG: response regulator transcription factor [Gammaproteobacteria bacterium]|jgi:YesN/AraC family two-component response regulator
MEPIKILLIDLRKHQDEAHALSPFEDKWSLQRVRPAPAEVPAEVRNHQPQILFFEYDFPDIPSLQAMKEIKVIHPSIPIVMVTEQHSEALAVWAHRARIWDYFVKPVSKEELIDCHETLCRLVTENKGNRESRKLISRSCPLPEDVRFRDDSADNAGKEIDPALHYINKMLTQKISQSAAAKACHMNVWQFSRQFKKVFNMTFQEYVVRRRMQEAIRLLENPSAGVTDVCYAVGYNDLSYFTRTFRRYVGTSPSLYKNQLNDMRGMLARQKTRGEMTGELQVSLN